jgi:hypothetical protein
MSRPPVNRRDYTRDAQSLQRILMAVMADPARSDAWKLSAAAPLRAIIDIFNGDAVGTVTPAPEPERASRRK